MNKKNFGGYRNYLLEANKNYEPLISVIVVVYNNVKHITNTINSIVSIDSSCIELIVIDGNSTDGTTDVIRSFNDKIAFWISEPDKGIYDAMNKGLMYAVGKYVWYINSGDEIYSSKNISSFIRNIDTIVDIYYGETIIINEAGIEIGKRRLSAPKELNWRSFRNGMVVSHQSIIIKKTLTVPYNLKYKCSADFEWVLQALRKANKICNANMVLSKFMDGGFTKKNLKTGLRERFQIMKNYYGFVATLLYHFLFLLRFTYYFFRFRRF